MERAPFGWNQPADFEDEDQSAPTRTPAQTERPARAQGPAHTEPTAADDRSAALDQFAADEQSAADRSADPDRPAFSDLPLDFERYHASYNAAERWNVDDTPKLGRDARIAYVLFIVAVAVAVVWVIQRDVQGPVASEEASPASTDPPRAGSTTPPREELDLGTPVRGVDDLAGPTATVDLPAAPSVDPSLPGGSIEARGSKDQSLLDSDAGGAKAPPLPDTNPRLPRIEPPPLKGQTVDVGAETRKPTPPPLVRRPLAIAPPPRPPYQATFGEPAAPPGAARTEPTPRPAPATPVPAPATPAPATSAPSAETAPSPPRVTAAEAVPLPSTAVEDRALAPPPTPPPAAVVTPPPAAAPTPAPSAAAPSAPAAAPTTASRTPAADGDSGAIRDVLGRYRSAFNTLDAKAAQQVWPSVNERTLDRAFGQLEQQNVSFDTCIIYVKGVLAEANCRGTTRFVTRVGNRSTQVESREWSFSLRKANSGGWLIQEVQTR